VLSPPPDLSQSATSFIASCCQGIHQTPLSRLIRSRRRRALLREVLVRNLYPLPLWSEVDFDPTAPLSRAPSASGNDLSIDAAFSVSVIDLERLSWLPGAPPRGDLHPRTAKRRTRPNPHSGRTQNVSCYCSLHDVTLPDVAIRRSVSLPDVAIRRSVSLPRSRDRTGRRIADAPANRIVVTGRGSWWSLPGSNR
jgi:hypothetical protein